MSFEDKRAAHSGSSACTFHADAIAAWEKATAEGLPKSVTAPAIANLRLTRGEGPGAAAALTPADIAPGDHMAMRTLAATRIALQRESEAIEVLDRVLTAAPDDLDARWLLVRALFAQVARGAGDRRRFAVEAQRYVDAGGANAPLVRDWLTISS